MKAPFFNLIRKMFPVFVAFLFVSCATINTKNYEINDYELEEQICIVQVSDFHSNDFGKNEEKLVQKIRDASPDVIFFTGDTFEFSRKGTKTEDNVRLLLEGIKGFAPFYYITGNHEYAGTHNDDFASLIKEYGGTVLKDETAVLEIEKGIIEITGIDDPFADLSLEERLKEKDDREKYLARLKNVSEKAANLKDELKQNRRFRLSVLLAHRPEYIHEYLKYDYDLILSGHAHGGQWRFPPFINGLYAPMQGLFPKYAGGRYKFSKSPAVFIVSRGLSYQVPNVPRIFNPPELVVIHIER